MATAYAALDSLAEILKNVYGEGLKNQFNDEKLTYNQFPKSDRRPGGNGYIFGLRYARAQGTGGRLESAQLPQALTGIKDQGTITPRYVYGSLQITGPAIETAKSNSEAFVNSLSDEIDDIYQSIIVDLNRQCHWDGFGKVGTTSAIATPIVNATWNVTFDNDIGVMYMQEGMMIDFFQSATADATCCSQRIKSINPATKVVTFEAAANLYKSYHPNATIAAYTADASTVASGSLAIKSGARLPTFASTDRTTELTGLTGIYDDGTALASFENITVSTNPKWKANIISNSAVNRELSIDLMLNAVDLTRIRSGLNVDKIRMGLGQRRKYANLLLPDVRFAPTVLKGGYETLSFSGGDGSLEIVVDPMTQPNMIFFEPNGVIQKYELASLGWGNLDGSQLHWKTNYDEWQAFLRLYSQLGTEQRNCLSVVSDLVEPTMY